MYIGCLISTFLFLMVLRTPISNRTDPPFPYPTLFRSYERRGTRGLLHRPHPSARRKGALLSGGLVVRRHHRVRDGAPDRRARRGSGAACADRRSEEHTSELQSLMRNSYAAFCLKKQTNPYVHETSMSSNDIKTPN